MDKSCAIPDAAAILKYTLCCRSMSIKGPIFGENTPDSAPVPPRPSVSKGSSISSQMQSRLNRIDDLVAQGFAISKANGAFPQMTASNGSSKNIFSGPAGFSWIAFLFPFAVCAQIKEWSYFLVSGIFFLLSSVISKITGWSLVCTEGVALAVLYAYYYPYLRWLANKRKQEELSVGSSIFFGLVLSIISAIPSIIVDVL